VKSLAAPGGGVYGGPEVLEPVCRPMKLQPENDPTIAEFWHAADLVVAPGMSADAAWQIHLKLTRITDEAWSFVLGWHPGCDLPGYFPWW
jgi:hypothetical protein